MYTEKNTLGELIQLESVKTLLEQIAPGMTSGPALDQIKGMTIEQLLTNLPEKKYLMNRQIRLKNCRSWNWTVEWSMISTM